MSAFPIWPEEGAPHFRATLHGSVFGERRTLVEALVVGDRLRLIPDPPVEAIPRVWVHREEGDVLGYLPLEIGDWLAPWLLAGGAAEGRVLRVDGPEAPSWKRVLMEVWCQGSRLPLPRGDGSQVPSPSDSAEG
jgi:hypothetical protein